MERSIAFGPSAFRGVLRNAEVTGVRAVQPVVRRAEPERTATTNPQTTTYTPQASTPPSQPLYSRKGAPASSSAVFASASWERKDTFDLQVQTAEGDLATLRFSQALNGAVSTGEVRNASGNAQAIALDVSQNTGLEVTVTGELNEKERASINTLANQVRSVANDFFNDNMEGALKTASGIDISQQGDTLRAYAFSLETRETQLAAAIYEDVAKSTGPLNVQVPWTPPETVPAAAPAPAPAPAPAEGGAKGLLKELLAMYERLTGVEPASARSASPA